MLCKTSTPSSSSSHNRNCYLYCLLGYWYFKRRFHLMVLVYSLVAYAVAIALKYAVQIPTINLVTDYLAKQHRDGVYMGCKQCFRGGLAFLVAWYFVKQGKLELKDAEGYGVSLAFWKTLSCSVCYHLSTLLLTTASSPPIRLLRNALQPIKRERAWAFRPCLRSTAFSCAGHR